MFGSWVPGDASPLDVPPLLETSLSGGTEHLLPAERKKCSFDVQKLTNLIDGGEEKTAKRRWIWSEGEQFDNSQNYNITREQLVAQHVERFLALHGKYVESYLPSSEDVLHMTTVSKNGGAFGLHYGAFVPTLLSQCNDKQRANWLFPAFQMKITGCLAQTELGHGSNVRALQTTATYDKETQTFILNSPTLKSIKWWPGGLAKTSTHAIVYAQLIIDGKEYGIHSFFLQIRDENHQVLEGIELGEVGRKIGDNFTETGFMRLNEISIPRNWMLMKNQKVTKKGEYVKKTKGESSDKIQYSTMLSIRAALVIGAGYKLATGVCIAARYSVVRQQGFKDTENVATRFDSELSILDYQVQLYRILKQISIAYAFVFTGKFLSEKFNKIRSNFSADPESTDLSELPEMHASSAGLKALCTFTAAEGLEECRKCCGGHGVLLYSGIAQLTIDYVTYCTAEGDRIILELQSARYLIKSYHQAKQNLPLSGVCEYLSVLSNKDFHPSQLPKCNARTAEEIASLPVLLELFKYRALRSVIDAAERLESELAKKVPITDARNNSALELVHASRCHCFYIILRSFAAEIEKAEDLKVKTVLARVCSLFALIHIQENLGDWFDYLQSSQIQWIKAATRNLLSLLRPDVIGLTDAFEFPDNVLNSAIGRHDGKVYESLYAAAKSSELNKKDPFEGYKHLAKYLDKDFLRENARKVISVNKRSFSKL